MIGAEASTIPDTANMVFLGTSVISGTATAQVVTTGKQTAFGDIAERLAARPQEIAFDRGLRQFGGLIMRAVVFLVVSIAWHHDTLESLLFAIALAVGLTPEFLPMITSVTLASGHGAQESPSSIFQPFRTLAALTYCVATRLEQLRPET